MNTPTSTPHRAPLIAYLIANVVSICGTRVSAIAIPWFVLTSTGSPVKTGLVALAEMAPLVICKVIGGPWIDRVGARRVSILADSASTGVVAAIPLLHALHLLSFPVLLALVAVAGALRGPGDSAKGVMIPEIAIAARVPMERVTGLSSTTDRLAGFIAVAIAGGLITLVGEVNALWVDAASFGVCAALIYRWLPHRQPVVEEATTTEDSRYGQQLLDGWRFLRGDKLILPLVLMIGMTNLLDTAVGAVFLPVWINDHGLGPGHLSLVLTAFGVTATLFALVASAIGHRIPRKAVFIVAFLICGAPRFVVMAVDAPLWALAGIYAVCGIGAGFINPVLSALFIERIPPHLFGRVNSLSSAVAWAGVPLGGLFAGAAIAVIGMAPALLLAGALFFAATMSPVFFGRKEQWRKVTAPDQTDPQESAEPQDRVAVPAA
ncbi:MFS transporter [Kribbella sp. NBC_01505]|uniref:MFS transporter n=1 Tax=Kribbella sp. NBC_01505 TaxID=2903580 RepID=UPI00386B9C21